MNQSNTKSFVIISKLYNIIFFTKTTSVEYTSISKNIQKSLHKAIKFFLLSCFCLSCLIFLLFGIMPKTPVKAAPMTTTAVQALPHQKPLNVLFIGNSHSRLTSSGLSIELPLKELAQSAGYAINIKTISHAYARWEQYANPVLKKSYHQEMLTQLKKTNWDYIVLQERGKWPLNWIDLDTYPNLLSLKKTIKSYQPKAKIILYMTHGFDNGQPTTVDGRKQMLSIPQMQEQLSAAYGYLSNKTGLTVVPVGMHIARSSMFFPTITLIGHDNRHLNYAGYYLAASSFYYEFFGSAPMGEPTQLTRCKLTKNELRNLESLVTARLNISDKNLNLNRNQTKTLTAYSENSTVPSIIRWKSLNPEVAIVSSITGTVVGIAPGKANIMAISGDGLQTTCSVIVAGPPTSTSAKTSFIIAPKKTLNLRKKAKKETLNWHSYNKKVATVSANGVVTARSPGQAKITVKNYYFGTITKTYYIYVKHQQPTGVKVTPASKPTARKTKVARKITWNKNLTVKKYKIYRATKKNGKYQLIGTSSKQSYIDRNTSTKKTYYYKVAASNKYLKCDSKKSTAAKSKNIN